MRRILVLALLVVLALSLSAFAAEGSKMPMAFGIKAGLSLGNATGDSLTTATGASKSMLAGFLAGAVFCFEPTKGLGIQPEIFYVQKGVKLTLGGAEDKLKVDYLEVPVLVKWLPQMKDSKIQPTIFAGPYLGILLSSKAESAGGASVDEKDNTNSTDFGITGGAGLGYKMTKGELFLDA